MTNNELIGRRVKYTGKDHPNCGTKLEGSTGTIVEYHKKVGKGKAYSAHVIIRVDNMPHVVFNTAYPFTTWAFIEDAPDLSEVPPMLYEDYKGPDIETFLAACNLET